MPGCAVIGCSNSSSKGFLMRIIPADPTRRELWLAAIKRPELRHARGSAVCEIHFDQSSWEKVRVDGSRKLKISAVPKLHLNAEGKRKFKQRSRSQVVQMPNFVPDGNEIAEARSNNAIYQLFQFPPSNQQTKFEFEPLEIQEVPASENDPEERLSSPEQKDYQEIEDVQQNTMDEDEEWIEERLEEEFLEGTLEESQEMEENLEEEEDLSRQVKSGHDKNCCEKLKHCLELLEKSEKLRRALQQRLESVEAEREQLLKSSGVKALKRIFNEDQIDVLMKRSKTCSEWSNDTIKRAIMLKFSCGDAGYEEILKQNIPLPSLHTLRRIIEIMKNEESNVG